MFTKTTGWLIIPCWLAAMSWLVARDVWPRWTALEAPAVRREQLLDVTTRQAQYTISNEFATLGTIWTWYLVEEDSIRREDLVLIEHFPLDITPLRIAVNSVFTAEGILDEFNVRMENADTLDAVKLHGERFHSDFSFRLESGPVFKSFKIPFTEGSLIAGAFNPFAEFRDLRVGQTWHMQVFNPVAALTNIGNRFIPMLVQVTGEERIDTGHWQGNCLVVEAGYTTAWVGAGGEVRAQEVTLPMVGKIRIVHEPRFDADRRNAVRRMHLDRSIRWSD